MSWELLLKERKRRIPQTSCFFEGRRIFKPSEKMLYLSVSPNRNTSLVPFRFNIKVMSANKWGGFCFGALNRLFCNFRFAVTWTCDVEFRSLKLVYCYVYLPSVSIIHWIISFYVSWHTRTKLCEEVEIHITCRFPFSVVTKFSCKRDNFVTLSVGCCLF